MGHGGASSNMIFIPGHMIKLNLECSVSEDT